MRHRVSPLLPTFFKKKKNKLIKQTYAGIVVKEDGVLDLVYSSSQYWDRAQLARLLKTCVSLARASEHAVSQTPCQLLAPARTSYS